MKRRPCSRPLRAVPAGRLETWPRDTTTAEQLSHETQAVLLSLAGEVPAGRLKTWLYDTTTAERLAVFDLARSFAGVGKLL